MWKIKLDNRVDSNHRLPRLLGALYQLNYCCLYWVHHAVADDVIALELQQECDVSLSRYSPSTMLRARYGYTRFGSLISQQASFTFHVVRHDRVLANSITCWVFIGSYNHSPLTRSCSGRTMVA